MNKVLITGFEPFGGEKINPSWEVVKRLDNQQIAGRQVIALQLPCVFGASLQLLSQQIDALKPELVIAVGQAGGRPDVTIERVAINVDDARIADNHGQQPIDQPVIAGGPAAYFSRLPIKAMVEALRQAGIPASVSQTAGTYVCNHVMYGLLAHIEPLVGVKGGFIHIPYLPEQAAWQNNTPSMSLAVLVEALSLAIETALLAEEDIAVSGGATH